MMTTITLIATLYTCNSSDSLTCTISLTMALSVLILARCSPLMFSPIQVMRVNLARLLIASPVVIRTKPNRRESSKGRDGRDCVRLKYRFNMCVAYNWKCNILHHIHPFSCLIRDVHTQITANHCPSFWYTRQVLIEFQSCDLKLPKHCLSNIVIIYLFSS